MQIKRVAGFGFEEFRRELRTQRWDDHRFYHQSRINQALHLVSALSFLAAYVLMFKDPVLAALVGWLVAMLTRQSGHFFFEPKGYDAVNQATHEFKERVKVGYNLRRKVVLHAIWALAPVFLWWNPSCGGLLPPAASPGAFLHNVGVLWLAIGGGALLLRMLQLFVIRDVRTGLAWVAKILTDPFYDVMQYWRAPYHLLRGELMDPMSGEQRA
jgi:hypothetical protein